MEHALRSHIRKHLEQDPVRYRKLSERLNQILQAIKGQWQQQVIAFGELIKETCADTMPDDTRWADLPAHYLSFVHLLQDSLEADASAAQQDKLRDLCIELVDMILAELSATFWEPHKRPAQEALGSRIFALLRASRLVPRDATAALKDRILDLARANHERLLKV
jgi:type I restriction enzyme R subunit